MAQKILWGNVGNVRFLFGRCERTVRGGELCGGVWWGVVGCGGVWSGDEWCGGSL